MEIDVIKIAGTFGIPVAILTVLILAMWRVAKYLANEVVKPLTTAAVQYMTIHQKAAVEMVAMLLKVSQNLEAIHADQLKLLQQYKGGL